MKGLFPNEVKKYNKKTIAAIVISSCIIVGSAGCSLKGYFNNLLPFGNKHEKLVEKQAQTLIQSVGIHAQKLITVTYDESLKQCVVIVE